MKKRRKYTESRSSQKGGRRGCLCPDGKTYSSKCCDGSLQAQGIGNIVLSGTDSAGTITAEDTESTSSSTSTALPSQGGSTVVSQDTESTSSSTSSSGPPPSQGNSTIVSQDTTNTIVNASETSVVSMAVTAGTYSVGDSLPLVATFNEEVTVDTTGGTPTVDATINDNEREFSYSNGSGTEDLTFEYTLVSDDAGFDSVEVASDIQLNGGSISDNGGDPISTETESIDVSIENVTPPPALTCTGQYGFRTQFQINNTTASPITLDVLTAGGNVVSNTLQPGVTTYGSCVCLDNFASVSGLSIVNAGNSCP